MTTGPDEHDRCYHLPSCLLHQHRYHEGRIHQPSCNMIENTCSTTRTNLPALHPQKNKKQKCFSLQRHPSNLRSAFSWPKVLRHSGSKVLWEPILSQAFHVGEERADNSTFHLLGRRGSTCTISITTPSPARAGYFFVGVGCCLCAVETQTLPCFKYFWTSTAATTTTVYLSSFSFSFSLHGFG